MTVDVPLQQWHPQAVVFDWDGTLADTRSAWALAKHQIFSQRERTLQPGLLTSTYGLHPSQTAKILAEALGGDPTVIEVELTEYATANLAGSIDEMPGAYALAQRLAGQLPVMVASNSPRVSLKEGLRHTRFAFAPSQIISADDVGASKPDPALYLEACRRLDVHPSNVLAFEDSTAGVRSAVDAGLRVIGVSRWQIDDARPRIGLRPGPDLMLHSLQDPALEDLLNVWVPRSVVPRQRRS